LLNSPQHKNIINAQQKLTNELGKTLFNDLIGFPFQLGQPYLTITIQGVYFSLDIYNYLQSLHTYMTFIYQLCQPYYKTIAQC